MGEKNTYLQQIYNSSDGNFADGVPVVWASQILGEPIRGELCLMFFHDLQKRAEEKGFSFFFFLWRKRRCCRKIVGYIAETISCSQDCRNILPPFAEKFSDEENSKMIALVNSAKPDVLWVSLTAPKQDYWIYEHFAKLNVKLQLVLAVPFEVTAGLIPRAPQWMQRNGLEWFFRLMREPRRMFYRYVIEAPRFIPLVLLQKINCCRKKME